MQLCCAPVGAGVCFPLCCSALVVLIRESQAVYSHRTVEWVPVANPSSPPPRGKQQEANGFSRCNRGLRLLSPSGQERETRSRETDPYVVVCERRKGTFFGSCRLFSYFFFFFIFNFFNLWTRKKEISDRFFFSLFSPIDKRDKIRISRYYLTVFSSLVYLSL